jgi:hypothetical protein
MARYLLAALAVRRGAYGSADLGHAWWARAAGVAQMAVLTAALAPTAARAPGRAARAVARPVAALQLACLALLARPLLCHTSPRVAGAERHT